MRNETTGTDVASFSTVEFGYRVSSNTSEPTYMGIVFGAEMPYEELEWGSSIT